MDKIYIVVFSHKHGVDAWPSFQSNRPIEGDIITDLRKGEMWDESDDEHSCIDIFGPFSKDEPRG